MSIHRLLDPDKHLLDVALRAGMEAVDLSLVSVEAAVQNPKNREWMRGVLWAIGHELELDAEVSR